MAALRLWFIYSFLQEWNISCLGCTDPICPCENHIKPHWPLISESATATRAFCTGSLWKPLTPVRHTTTTPFWTGKIFNMNYKETYSNLSYEKRTLKKIWHVSTVSWHYKITLTFPYFHYLFFPLFCFLCKCMMWHIFIPIHFQAL